VRGAALQALDHCPAVGDGTLPAEPAVLGPLWLARRDPQEANAEVAQGLWEEAGCALPADFAPALLQHLGSPHAGEPALPLLAGGWRGQHKKGCGWVGGGWRVAGWWFVWCVVMCACWWWWGGGGWGGG
jgi:hypothetical protein